MQGLFLHVMFFYCPPASSCKRIEAIEDEYVEKLSGPSELSLILDRPGKPHYRKHPTA